jgi:hypothetical protein
MKSRLYITISIIIMLTLSMLALNRISEANYEFLNSKYRKFIDIQINSDTISLQFADKLFTFNNFFSQK